MKPAFDRWRLPTAARAGAPEHGSIHLATLHPPKFFPIRADIPGMIVSFRKAAARRKVSRLIREGVGVRERKWAFEGLDGGNRRDLAFEILTWVRSAMGTMRRPYGVDHVALALACRDESGRIVCSNTLGVSRPDQFYGPQAEDRILAFFDDAIQAGARAEGEIAAALLCLGDVAYAMERPAEAA